MRILVCDPLNRIDEEQHHIGRLDGLQCFHHGELFNGLKDLAFASQTCGINQLEFLPTALKGHGDRIARGSRQIKCHQALFSKPGVNQGGFAHVRPPSDCQLDGARIGLGLRLVYRGQQRRQRQVQQRTNALAVGS